MIATESLSVSYAGRTVLRAASLQVNKGEVLALVGPSGCGKSSFLAALNRMTDLIPGASVSGCVRFDGKDIRNAFPSAAHLRRSVGMIFQKPTPFALSIRRNIELALKEHGLKDRALLQQSVERSLRQAGLWEETRERLDRPASELSGGQQQRLCIARALALQPEVLLMDEPCSALDPFATERIEQLIQGMRGRYTVLIVTHNLAQARRIADRVAVFWTQDGIGEIVEIGPTQAIFEHSTNETVQRYVSGSRG